MLRNYVKAAVRRMRRHLGYTVINVVGLAVGLAVCGSIGLYVADELSYDDFHPTVDRLYRVALDAKAQDRRVRKPVSPMRMAETLTRTASHVDVATRFDLDRSVALTVDGTSLTENKVVEADSSFFDVFGGFEMLHGAPGDGIVPITFRKHCPALGPAVNSWTLSILDARWRTADVRFRTPKPDGRPRKQSLTSLSRGLCTWHER
jgi:putative ABC transport system permease protein